MQAEALVAAGLSPHAVIQLTMPEDTLVAKARGRRLDPETGAIYDTNGPSPPGDSAVIARLVRLADDRSVLRCVYLL